MRCGVVYYTEFIDNIIVVHVHICIHWLCFTFLGAKMSDVRYGVVFFCCMFCAASAYLYLVLSWRHYSITRSTMLLYMAHSRVGSSYSPERYEEKRRVCRILGTSCLCIHFHAYVSICASAFNQDGIFHVTIFASLPLQPHVFTLATPCNPPLH